MWRCFVAVPIGEELRAAIEATVRDLRARDEAASWRWTDPEGWHVTLAFLGATDAGAVAALGSALQSAVRADVPFQLMAGGLGAFPGRARARVLWYGVADPRGELRRLARAVSAAVGLADDGRFRGHMTLARARDRDGADATPLLAAQPSTTALQVDRVVLYRSHLGRGPARYEALATACFGGRSA